MDLEAFRRKFFDPYYYFPDEEKRLMDAGAFACVPDTATVLYEHFRNTHSASVRDRCAATDLATQLPEEFLAMTDRFSMAHSIEARTPFLDAEFVALVQSIPAKFRTRRHDLKGLLRQTLSQSALVPQSVLKAPKKGFVIPLSQWLRGRLRPLCEALLSPQRLAAQGLLKPEFYTAYVRPHLEGQADFTTRLWGALMLQLWLSTFVERDGSRPLASLEEAIHG